MDEAGLRFGARSDDVRRKFDFVEVDVDVGDTTILANVLLFVDGVVAADLAGVDVVIL